VTVTKLPCVLTCKVSGLAENCEVLIVMIKQLSNWTCQPDYFGMCPVLIHIQYQQKFTNLKLSLTCSSISTTSSKWIVNSNDQLITLTNHARTLTRNAVSVHSLDITPNQAAEAGAEGKMHLWLDVIHTMLRLSCLADTLSRGRSAMKMQFDKPCWRIGLTSCYGSCRWQWTPMHSLNLINV